MCFTNRTLYITDDVMEKEVYTIEAVQIKVKVRKWAPSPRYLLFFLIF